MGIASDLIYIVVVALFGGVLAHALRQPLVIGYIFAGVVVGPYTAGPTVERTHEIEMLAEVGVALLLFTLGLEFSLGELRRLSRVAFIGTPIQILLCLFVSYISATLLGFSSTDALWLGGSISLSSTMVVLKTLSSRGSLGSPAGRLMLTILIAQDLAVIPLVLILPQVSGDVIEYSLILSAILESVLFLVGMYYAGTRLFPWIFSKISRANSKELFFLATLAVALGAGYMSYQMGLSFALGAFVAGMLLSETDFNHQALSDVSSLRDLFGLIFFVSVGMLFDPVFVLENLGRIVMFTAIVILSKAVVIGGVMSALGFGRHLSTSVGLGLSQIGEFAFVVASAGSRVGQLSHDSYSLIIAVAVASMIATPSLLAVAARLFSSGEEPEPDLPGHNEDELKDHVVIVGGGFVGRYIAKGLTVLKVPLVIVESDYASVIEIRNEALPVIFGDGTRGTILESAHVERAKLVLLTVTNDSVLPSILRELRKINEHVPVVVRLEDVEALGELAPYSVREAVQPQFEVGLEMIAQSLMALGMRDAEIFSILAQFRAEGYGLKLSDHRRIKVTRLLSLIWVEVGEVWRGKTLRELAFRAKHKVYVAAVIRGEEVTPNPPSDYKVEEGDAIGVMGSHSEIEAFQQYVVAERELEIRIEEIKRGAPI